MFAPVFSVMAKNQKQFNQIKQQGIRYPSTMKNTWAVNTSKSLHKIRCNNLFYITSATRDNTCLHMVGIFRVKEFYSTKVTTQGFFHCYK